MLSVCVCCVYMCVLCVCVCAYVCVCYLCMYMCVLCVCVCVCVCVYREIHVSDAAKRTPGLSPPELREVLAALRVHCWKEELMS